MDWKQLLAYITGTVDQELLLRNEYLVTENRMLRDQLKGRVRLSDGERKALAEIGQQLGKQALQEVAKGLSKNYGARTVADVGTMSTNHFSNPGSRWSCVSTICMASFVSFTPVCVVCLISWRISAR